MAQTKFGVGQRVSIPRSAPYSAAPSGSYRIVSALPRDQGPQQYRVRNESEAFDRILDEARFEAFSAD